ncbi:ubiquitin-protein ligase e3 c [Seiridium cupressi]
MFHTFTGHSKRPRNVNLSGQQATNPWASTGWTSAPSGASQTVANAQAEREKRQKERDQIAAKKSILRVWRGHKVRKQVQSQRRQDWDELYSKDVQVKDRISAALPLLNIFFDPRDPADQARLDSFVNDLKNVWPLDLEDRQLRKLTSVSVAALEKRSVGSSQDILALVVKIIKVRPSSITSISDRYYKLVASYCEQIGGSSAVELPAADRDCLAAAIAAPLGQLDLESYEAFAFSFLTTANLFFLQRNLAQVAGFLDVHILSQSIITGLVQHHRAHQNSRDDLMWLLAHFIALNRASPASQGSAYLEALYRQLTELSADIRMRTDPQDDGDLSDDESNGADPNTIGPLPPYVLEQLKSLVSEDGVTELLSRFTSTAVSSAQMSEDASLLAGYTLILLRCFPSYGDDIKMRLFHGDISTHQNHMIKQNSSARPTVPSVKFLWQAVLSTSIFPTIAQKDAEQKARIVFSLLQPDPLRDQEWRTLLLFLELYNFLLRVTDDEDFLPADSEIVSVQSSAASRIRSSGLNLPDLKSLISFLKNLSFPLYYNLPDILPSSSRPAAPSVSSIFGSSGGNSSQGTPDKITTALAGIHGLDVLTLRTTATATMRSLYERDSRRPFLPKDFWLMTSRFDMDSFTSAVVLEEQREFDAEDEDEDMIDMEVERHHGFHTASGHRLSRAAQIERQRQHKRAQRENLLAQVGPKLEILRNMPFTIPFEVRVQIFRQFVQLDKSKRRKGFVDADQWRMSVLHGPFGQHGTGRDVLGRHSATIKRGQLFHDAYDQFYSLGESLKEPIQITFVDQFDQPEAGIDGGGVTKEFLTSVTSEAFNPEHHGLFTTNSQNLLYPNPTAYDERMETLRYYGIPENSAEWNNRLQELTKQYEFLGRIVGKCMYEGILIDLSFASFFLLKWASSGQNSSDFRTSLNDLRDLDPDLYKGLITLKNYPGDVSDLALDFTINDRITNPETGQVRTITRPLRKDGEHLPVTNKDRPLYISYVARHRLVAQPYRQTQAFLRGLGSIITPSWLSMFNQSELQRLVGGDSSEIDVEDLRSNTIYSGLYVIGDDGLEHPTVQMFWKVMHELEDEQRREVLKYVTSTPRAPLLGFSQLSPRFSIRDGGTDEERLPSTSTCVNLLKLPRYSSVAILKSKLLYAIQSGAGFDLS